MRALALVIGLTLVALPNLAAAQGAQVELLAPKARQGYYIGGGPLILNWVIVDDDAGSLGAMLGFGGAFRFGQKVNEWLSLGLVFGGGAAGNADWTAAGGGLLLEVTAQPWLDSDLAFRGGIGVAGLGTTRVDEDQESDDDPEGTVGSIYKLGASYELFPWYEPKDYDSGGFGLGVFVEGQINPGLGGLTAYGVTIGLELTWWSGLDKNKLDLPVDAAFSKSE